MLRQSRSRVSLVIRAAAAPVASAVAVSLLAGVAEVRATTWIGTSGNWNDTASWRGTPNPPSDVITSTGGPTVYIGNNGTVTFDGPDAAISRFNLGFSYVGMPLASAGGSTNPGTGVLNVSAGVLRTNQDLVIGDGAAGTLNINGGTLYVAASKHVYVGATANGTINLSAGNLYFGNKYGIEDAGGSSAFNMTGGNLEFRQFSGAAVDDNQNQILVDDFTFSGGTLGGAATTGAGFMVMTVHHVSGNGSVAIRKNSGSIMTFDLADASSTWSGTSAGAGNGSATNNYGTFIKTGTGQLTINNTQAGFKRDVQVHGGTLVLDYATLPGGIVDDGAGIAMRGGTLRLKGDGGNTTELIGLQQPFRSAEGGSTVILDPNGGTVTLNTTGTGSRNGTRAVGSTIDFQAATGTLGTEARVQITTTTNRVNNVLKGWTVNGGTEWGTRSGAGFIVPLTNYEGDADLGVAVSGAAKNMKPTGPQSDLAASAQFNLVNLTGTTGINMTGAGTTLSLTMGGIIGNTTGSITGGAITVTSAAPATLTPTDLVVVTPLDLLIGSAIVDNGDANSPVALTKSGPGTLTVSGTNTYSNSTYVSGGTLKLGAAAALPGTTTVVMSNTPGATLDLNDNSVSVAGLSGGGSSGGEVRLTGGATLNITGTAASTFAGAITGSGAVTKSTSGELALTGKSTYTGVTSMSGGATLIVTSLADAGQPSSIGAAGAGADNLVLDNATLRSNMKTTMTTNRLFSVGPGGATLSGNPGTSSSTGYFAPLRFTSTGTIGMSGTPSARTLTLDADSTAQSGNELALNLSENKLAAVIPDSGAGSPTSVTKQGVGLWHLDAPSTYTGATTISAGILRVSSVADSGSPSSIGAATDGLVLGGATLQYVGAGHSTNRLVTLTGSAANVIDASGAGAVSFTNTGAAGIGSGGLQLTGTNTGGNTFSHALSGASGVTKAGAGTWTLNGNNTYTGITRVNAGRLVQANSLTTSSAVNVQGDGVLELAAGGGSMRVINTPAVTIAAGAKIDLQDNKLVTDTPAGTATAGVYSGVQGEVQRAYVPGAGSWAGNGLTTSQPKAAEGLTTIAVLTGEQYADTTFAGQSITPTSTIAAYTYAGDTNLDGQVTGDDYGTIDFAILVPGSDGYYNGDFNYDGTINGDDYGVIDFTIIAQGAPIPMSAGAAPAGLAAVTAVPEPASILSLTAAGAAITLGRRRRRI